MTYLTHLHCFMLHLQMCVFYLLIIFLNEKNISCESLVLGKTVAAVETGVAAFLAAPAVLAGAVFLAAGPIAALLQVTIIMTF